jgi:flagellar protein FlgJ
MTIGPIANLTPQHQAPDADEASVASQRKAAQQFEAIFLRQLMGSLEKAGSMGGKGDGGSAIFGSMMVTALADNAAASGGIGLGDIIFRAMMPPAAPGAAAQGAAAADAAARDTAAGSAATGGARATTTPRSVEPAATPQLLPVLPGGS